MGCTKKQNELKSYWAVFMKKTDVMKVVAGLFILGFAIIFFLVFTRSQVEVVFPQVNHIGAAGPARLDFTELMDTASVEERISVVPQVEVRFKWVQKTLWIWPETPPEPGEYELVLQPGSKSLEGRPIEETAVWPFSIRDPQLVFLYPASGQTELWKYDPISGTNTQLTNTGGKVYDYTVSKDGELIAFSVTNASGGYDLWTIGRDGGNPKKLVDCGNEACIEPAISPDGLKIAYSRAASGIGEHLEGSTIWLVDIKGKKSSLLVDDPTIYGRGSVWSPMGDRLAFLDLSNGLFRIFDFEKLEITNLQSTGQEAGVWSPDGSKMLIPSEYLVGIQSFTGLSLVDFEAEITEPLFTQNQNMVDYFAPDYSPRGKEIIVGRREQLTNGRSSSQIWLVDLESKKFEPITADHNYSHGGFHWGPTGKQVVYQRYLLGSSEATPEILLWDRGSGISRLIIENAAIPQWLP